MRITLLCWIGIGIAIGCTVAEWLFAKRVKIMKKRNEKMVYRLESLLDQQQEMALNDLALAMAQREMSIYEPKTHPENMWRLSHKQGWFIRYSLTN